MSAAQQAYEALIADASLDALIDGRLYPSRLPQAEPNRESALFPCVVYRQVSLADAPESHDGLSGWERPRVQLDCWGEAEEDDSAYAVAHAVADVVKTALRALTWRVENEIDMPEAALNLHRVVVDALLWTESDD